MYVESCPGYVEGRVCSTAYYSARLSKILKYLAVLSESLERLSAQHEAGINKREIYYKNIKLFDTQDQVNSTIEEISFLLSIPRNYLKIVSKVDRLQIPLYSDELARLRKRTGQGEPDAEFP